jgi:hypothetical protein
MQFVRILALMGVLLATGVVSSQAQEKKAVIYNDPHYPLAVGNQWRYKATVNDAAPQQVSITVDQAENHEYKFTLDKKPDSELVVRFRLKVVSGSKELTEYVGVLRNGAYRFSTAGKEITPPLCFLKLPVMKGDSWSVHSTSEGALVSGTFKSEEDSVQVPKGTFQAVHVTSQDFQIGAEKMSMDLWFVRDIGLVKQRVAVGNVVSTLELEDFKKGK